MDKVFINEYKTLELSVSRGDDSHIIEKAKKNAKNANPIVYNLLELCKLDIDKESLKLPLSALSILFDRFSETFTNSLSVVRVSDIKIIYDTILSNNEIPKFTELKELLAHGNRIFDSLFYLANKEYLDTAEQFKIKSEKSNIPREKRSNAEYGKRLVIYVSLHLVRGDVADIKEIPKVFKAECNDFLSTYKDYLSEDSLIRKIGFKWIESINFNIFPIQFQNRLKLSICGYRYINCIAQYGLKTNEPTLNAIYSLCIILKGQGTFIDIHPSFLNEEISKLSVKIGKACVFYIVNVFEKKEFDHLEAKALSKGFYNEKCLDKKYKTGVKLSDVEFLYKTINKLTPLFGEKSNDIPALVTVFDKVERNVVLERLISN